jgi:septal ring factor EnvC (AmiA/AmiB activator)
VKGLLVLALVGALVSAAPLDGGEAVLAADGSQLARVRSRISDLEDQLATLARQSADVVRRREILAAELSLAEARVEELELQLTASRDEAVRLQGEIGEISGELERRRVVLGRYLELAGLLGRPGALQLLYDASRGGELEDAVGTVAVLTAGQVELMQEYSTMQRERSQRLAALSRVLDTAQREAEELLARRGELTEIEARLDDELGRLERSQRQTASRLDEMRERAQALEHLLERVSARERLTGGDDIRRYRGALPWPAEGRVVVTFGRHYLPKYATYTLCNGLRMEVASGSAVEAVFPGVVAYARHFKGYGNMVIVDHGHGIYSLVAGLAAIHVRPDQQVDMGTRLGLAPPASDDGNLYVEFRVAGKAVDPRRWLQLDEGRS